MLKIINNLNPFFEDCYRRINVREYAKIISVSPPTASKILSSFYAEKILLKEKYKNYILFFANKGSKEFVDLSRMYWGFKLKKINDYIGEKTISPAIILFGSLSKAEAKSDSDIDIAVFARKKELHFEKFENNLKRKIQIFWFKSIKDIKNKELANNIINGYTLKGRLSL